MRQSQKATIKINFKKHVQKNKLGTVGYETLWKKGPDHMPKFRVAALLNGTRIAEGEGSSKKAAESVAAALALKRIIKGGKDK